MPNAAEVGSTANSYEILAKLAVGGMAEIFLARGASVAGVSRYVVLKRILRHRASDVQFVRMFLDEARLAAQLQHPNIAQVHDIGRLGDSYFFTMEYVHGETVRALLHRAHALRRQIPIGCVMTVIAGSAQGLHHAHERNGMDGRPLGIVHRDVSPSNLMISYEGNIKVVDFGVAKAADRVSETRSGTVKGKISYLCPEQCRGASVDRRGDLYSLGIVLWEMLTTHRLYKRASDFENMTAIVNDPVPRPSSMRADIPPELDALVLKLLAKRPEDRYQSGEELVEALEYVAARCGFVLSTSALGRYVREMFGQRPEPWIEMDGRAPPEGVTVTSQPIPAELAVPVADSVDNALLHVADLSAHAAAEGMFGAGSASGSASGSGPHGGPETTPMPAVQPYLQAVPPPPTAATWAAGMPPTLVPPPAPGPDEPRYATPAYGAPYPEPPSYSGAASYAGAPSSSGSVSGPRALPARGRVPLAVWILGPAAVIGVALGLLMSTRDDKIAGFPSDARAASVVPQPADAAEVTPPVDATAMAVAPPIDAADVVVAPPVDASQVAVAPPVDASAVAVAPPIDAAVARADAALVAKPDLPSEPTLTIPTDGTPSEIVAACSTLPSRPTGDVARRCTLAACRAHREPDARRWLAGVGPSRRAAVLATCATAGTPLEHAPPPPSTPTPPPQHSHVDAGAGADCTADPLACQH